MKALEKAAKDRGQIRDVPGTAFPSLDSPPEHGISLSPFSADTPSLDDSRPPPPPPPPPPPEPPPRAAPAPTPRDMSPHVDEADQARATTVMSAGIRSPGFISKMLARPVMLVSIVGGLFAVGFGIYIYLQIFHPAFFIKPPPPRPPQPAEVAPQPVAPPPGSPVPAAAVLTPPGTPEASPQGTGEPGAPGGSVVPQLRPPLAPKPPGTPPAPPVAAAVPGGPTIQVSQSRGEIRVNPANADAYSALENGRLDDAQKFYQQFARSEPKNPEPLLGLAAVAVQQGRMDEATSYYLKALELEPRNATAQAGLLSLVGRSDPLSAETKLKQLISREPTGFLYFTLGNLYSEQNMWSQAQQVYFQAFHLEPNRADYAYNLAVALEHIGQQKFALSFYRRAIQLAEANSRSSFDLSRARARISQLTPLVE